MKWLAYLALLGSWIYTVAFVTVHVVPTRMNLFSDTISMYALDRYGFVITFGFYCIGVTQLCLALVLFNRYDQGRWKMISAMLLLAGVGMFVVAIFPTLPPPASIADRFEHLFGALLQFICFPIAVVLLARKLPKGFFQQYTWFTGVGSAALIVLMLALFLIPSLEDFAYFGFIEKIDVVMINFWLTAMSWRLIRS